jgi:hypothetical protein
VKNKFGKNPAEKTSANFCFFMWDLKRKQNNITLLFNFWLLYVGRFFSSKNEHFCEKIEKN